MITVYDFIKLVQVFGSDHPIVTLVINSVKNENNPR